MNDIAANLSAVLKRIDSAAQKAGRNPEQIRLVTVTKTWPAEVLRTAHQAGIRLVGENYVQEAKVKITELADLDLEWHFIGGLQTNKAKEVVAGYSLIHSVDRLKLAKALNKRTNKPLNILIQVNVSGEETKGGTTEAEAVELIKSAQELDNINVKGLMTMPPFFDQPERARMYFRQLKELAEKARQITGLELPELSMGMSGDFEVAIEEGATLVRVGSAIFGQRNYNH